MRILLVEDDPILGDGIATGLRQAGFVVDWSRNAEAAALALETEQYSAVVLDIGLAGKRSGLQLLDERRRQSDRTPVLLVTARDTVRDRVVGLNAGADDYLVGPFDLEELIARLRALIRRATGHVQTQMEIRGLQIDPAARTCRRGGVLIDLSRREFALLCALAEHHGAVLSRERLEQALYAWGEEVESNTIEVHIHHLRRKLGNELIRTARGVGYAIDVAP